MKIYTEQELDLIIDKVIDELATQEKYNKGEEPEWISVESIEKRLMEHIGTDWEVR